MKPRNVQQLARVSATEPVGAENLAGNEVALQSDQAPLPFWLRLLRGVLQLLLPLAILAAAFGVYQYLKSTKPETRKRPAQEAVFSVRTVPVAFANHQPFLTLYGTTVAGREVELRSLVAGRT